MLAAIGSYRQPFIGKRFGVLDLGRWMPDGAHADPVQLALE